MEDASKFAEGTRVLEPRAEYRIRIYYREPTYARHAQTQEANYRWTYRIVASSEEEARSMALYGHGRCFGASSLGDQERHDGSPPPGQGRAPHRVLARRRVACRQQQRVAWGG